MKKRLKVKPQMTGRELASILKRSHLKWNNGSVIRREPGGSHSYCMIGQLARLAGVTNTTLEALGEGKAPSIIPDNNDSAHSKQECVQNFCKLGDKDIAVKGWIDEMLELSDVDTGRAYSELDEWKNRELQGSYTACEDVYQSNDGAANKEVVVKRLCNLGDEPIPVGKFVAELRKHDRRKGRAK